MLMLKRECKGLESRIELADELVQQYKDKIAPFIVWIMGSHGSGKSFVINNVLKKLENFPHMALYISFGERFIKYGSKTSKKELNSLSFSMGNQLISLGFGIGWENNNSTYNHIRNMLSNILRSDVIICVDDFSNADSEIRAMVLLIAKHFKELQEEFKVKIYMLLTDIDSNHIFNTSETIAEYALEKYDTHDITQYFNQRKKIILPQEEEIEKIAELCNGNLNLVEYLDEETIAYGKSYLEILEKIVNKRIAQLKQSGKRDNLNEEELEDMIFSASLSIKQFSARILTEIVKQEDSRIFRELNVAKQEDLITQYMEEYYDFNSYDIKLQLAKQTLQKRKDWLLTYYEYYTNNEQDEYYYRAYYLINYEGKISSASFALLMLAYSAALEVKDITKAQKIKEQLQKKSGNHQQYIDIFKSIENFYNALAANKNVEEAYNAIDEEELELPLKAELARAYFHYFYVNTNMIAGKALIVLEQCKEFALNELYIDVRSENLPKATDETILRLRIIYDIAPCVLDCLNQYDSFQCLYEKSKELSQRTHNSQKGRNLGLYIENVFNRKAFLFVNQTQCGIYYHKAKRYFKENEIWDEYCITLVCEAGTDIVIQQYEEALKCCNKAISVCEDKNIQLPLIEKLHNNKIIAEFLLKEKNTTSQKNRLSIARNAIKELKQLLMSRQCATEYVILTNICSLCLYCNNDKQYLSYKRKIEKLYDCKDISDIDDTNIDDFYRYYFSWFELFRNIRDEHWADADLRCNKLKGFVPALFQKQDIFWEQKNNAVKELVSSRQAITPYDFCHNLVKCNQREKSLAQFYHRGLMLSDLQYTSYI